MSRVAVQSKAQSHGTGLEPLLLYASQPVPTPAPVCLASAWGQQLGPALAADVQLTSPGLLAHPRQSQLSRSF